MARTKEDSYRGRYRKFTVYKFGKLPAPGFKFVRITSLPPVGQGGVKRVWVIDEGSIAVYTIASMTHKRSYTVIFKPEPEGGFTAIVPTLPGCVTYGKTLPEAKAMITDAIGGYIASLTKHHEPVPSDESAFFSTVNLAVPGAAHAYT